MTPQELKNSILQLAIQGGLVEQIPEEGSANELYSRIQAEKHALTKSGKIRKEKTLPEIKEEEIPFEIPDNWKWVRLGMTFCIEMGQSPDGTSVSEITEGIEFHQGKVYFGKKYLEQSPQNTSAPTKIAEPNSVLLCVRAPVGKVNITTRRICIGRGLCSVFPLADMDVDFVFYLLATYENTFIKQATGTTFIAITGDVVKNQLIPLPPLAEQKRIVAKIEELLPLIDRYEQAWTKLEDFNKRFPLDMQKSILQMAIQGKLVPQDASEGTGEELYKQIQEEKSQISLNGKKVKWKIQTKLKEGELPFDIPDSWKWVRLGDIISIESGKGLTSSQMQKGAVPVYGGNGITGYHNESLLHKETVVIGRVGFYCGSIHVTEKESWVTDNAFITTYPEKSIDRQFLVYILRHMNLGQNNNATAQPVVSGKKIYPLPFPIPPLAEQKRIVAKLEELLPLCERLKS